MTTQERLKLVGVNNIIEIFKLTKTFSGPAGTKEVFRNYSLDILDKQIVTILGASGCGKTTLLNIISGIEEEYEGEVRVKPKNIGYMFQNDLLLPWRNAKKNALLSVEIRKNLDKEKIRNRFEDLFHRFGLSGYERYYPHSLSMGMRQRVALVRTLLPQPDVLFLDEPFSALDYKTKIMLEKEVIDYSVAHGCTIIFVTHDIDEAIAVGNRLVVLKGIPAETVFDEKIEFVSDSMFRDPMNVRQDSKFASYVEKVWKKLQE